MNRWQRILVRVLVLAQLLVTAPLASALSVADRADAMGVEEAECPCCPDGADSLRDCLASCTLAALALPDIQVIARANVPPLRVDAAPSASLFSLADPPLKPPPIR